jgi:hypothetical protein
MHVYGTHVRMARNNNTMKEHMHLELTCCKLVSGLRRRQNLRTLIEEPGWLRVVAVGVGRGACRHQRRAQRSGLHTCTWASSFTTLSCLRYGVRKLPVRNACVIRPASSGLVHCNRCSKSPRAPEDVDRPSMALRVVLVELLAAEQPILPGSAAPRHGLGHAGEGYTQLTQLGTARLPFFTS